MKERALISVVIPSYNRADSVGQTIDSILAQKVDADVEIVIGDDCSTDNAREVLMRYKEQHPNVIRLIFHEQNMGLGANWATCVKACRGKYICNCDNDDYWHNEHKLQIQLDYMESHPDSNICITNHRTHNRTTGEIRECKAEIDRSVDIQTAMWHSGHFCNATIMYRADFMKAHLDLDEFIKRRLSLQDWPAWVILTAYTDIDVLPESTATFGIETVSITRPDSVERYAKRLDGDKEVCRYLGELFPEKFPYSDEIWENYAWGRLMAKAFDVGDYESAKKYGKKCSDVGKFKRICSQNRILFNLFIAAKKYQNIREFIRFGIVGALATGIHYGLYYLLNLVMNVNVAYTIGYVVAWCCNFYLSAHFTFKSETSVKRGVGFAISHGINYVLHMALLNLFLWLGLSETWAPIPVFCIVIPINFILVRYVFKSKCFEK